VVDEVRRLDVMDNVDMDIEERDENDMDWDDLKRGIEKRDYVDDDGEDDDDDDFERDGNIDFDFDFDFDFDYDSVSDSGFDSDFDSDFDFDWTRHTIIN